MNNELRNEMFKHFFKKASGRQAEEVMLENRRMRDLLEEALAMNLPGCTPEFQKKVALFMEGKMGTYGVGAKEQDRVSQEEMEYAMALRLLAKSVHLFKKYGLPKIADDLVKEAGEFGLEIMIDDRFDR